MKPLSSSIIKHPPSRRRNPLRRARRKARAKLGGIECRLGSRAMQKVGMQKPAWSLREDLPHPVMTHSMRSNGLRWMWKLGIQMDQWPIPLRASNCHPDSPGFLAKSALRNI